MDKITPHRTLAIVLLFLFHGLAVAPAAYCLSFLFSKHSTAQSITMAVFGITCVLFAIATAILRMSAVRYDGTVDESLMTASNIVKGIGMIIPTGVFEFSPFSFPFSFLLSPICFFYFIHLL